MYANMPLCTCLELSKSACSIAYRNFLGCLSVIRETFGHNTPTSQTDRTGQDRQTDRQRSDSIGRTVLQTVLQGKIFRTLILRFNTEHWLVFLPEFHADLSRYEENNFIIILQNTHLFRRHFSSLWPRAPKFLTRGIWVRPTFACKNFFRIR